MCTASRRISKSIILQYRSNRRGDEQCWQHCSNVQRWQRAVVAGGDRSGLSGRCTLGYSLGYCPLQTRILRSVQLHTGILCSAQLHTGILAGTLRTANYNTAQCKVAHWATRSTLWSYIWTSSTIQYSAHWDTHLKCILRYTKIHMYTAAHTSHTGQAAHLDISCHHNVQPVPRQHSDLPCDIKTLPKAQLTQGLPAFTKETAFKLCHKLVNGPRWE